MDAGRTAQTTELLQAMIRNECVNDGTAESGHEFRNAALLQSYLDGVGLDIETFDAAPGRTTLVAKIEGADPTAPSLCLNGHTDVVPVSPGGWSRDPFGGELVDGEVWGRGAVDMLNLTASMAVATRHLAESGFRPRGDLIFLAVADEESGSAHGARWMAEPPSRDHGHRLRPDRERRHPRRLGQNQVVSMRVGEKGVAWRRLTFQGTPGHGSMPFGSDNALLKAAAAVQRLADYRPAPAFHELWRAEVDDMDLDADHKAALLDEAAIDDHLAELPPSLGPGYLHACTHTTFSPNTAATQSKTNVIPDSVSIDVDIRTLPGEGPEEVSAHLREALGDLADQAEVEPLMNDAASISRTDTPLWDSLQRAVNRPFPELTMRPGLTVGFTDARVHRELGSIAYGAGLLSPSLSGGEFASRFHGNDERIDVESLALTTQLWIDTVTDLMAS